MPGTTEATHPAIKTNQKNYAIKPQIANEVLQSTGDEGIAIATGLKLARQHFKKKRKPQKTTCKPFCEHID